MSMIVSVPSLTWLLLGGVLLVAAGCSRSNPTQVERGEYLVRTIGCADCHTPHRLGENGPEPDPARHLSGHPETLAMPAGPALEEPWGFAGSGTMTAWSGPWGVSFTANLTPDPETGLGKWTAQMFRDTFRTARRMGQGRALLPPMPVQHYNNLTDGDLAAIYAYLRSIPPIRNRVPEPIPPAAR